MDLVMLNVIDIKEDFTKVNYTETVFLLKKDYEENLERYMFSMVKIPSLQKRLRLIVANVQPEFMTKKLFKVVREEKTGDYLYKQLKEFFGEDIDAMINRANLYIDNM